MTKRYEKFFIYFTFLLLTDKLCFAEETKSDAEHFNLKKQLLPTA